MAQVPGKKARATRARILDAAAVELRRSSVSTTRLADVASSAGIGTGSLYYHFRSRNELVESLLAAHMERLTADARAAVAELPRFASPLVRFHVSAAAHLVSLLTSPDRSAACVKLLGQIPQQTLANIGEHHRSFLAHWSATIEGALDSDATRNDLDRSVVRALLLTAFCISPDWIGPHPERLPPVETGTQFADVLCYGIASPLGRASVSEVPYTPPAAATDWYINPELPGGAVKLLDAAAETFRRDGYAESRVVDIAAAAGLQVGSFYHFFESREQLVATFLDTAWRRTLQLIDAVLDGLPGGTSPLDRLVAMIVAPLWADDGAASYVAALMRIHTAVPDDARPEPWGPRTLVGIMHKLLSEAADLGHLRSGSSVQTTTAVITAVLFWIDNWYDRSGPLGPAAMAAQVGRLLLDGIAVHSQPIAVAARSGRRDAAPRS